MAAIKSNVLKRWDTAPAGVRICCIKFVQKVVQVQTPAVIDPRVREAFLPCSLKGCMMLRFLNRDLTKTRSQSPLFLGIIHCFN